MPHRERFDPRYDPRFQRGYRPDAVAGSAGPSGPPAPPAERGDARTDSGSATESGAATNGGARTDGDARTGTTRDGRAAGSGAEGASGTDVAAAPQHPLEERRAGRGADHVPESGLLTPDSPGPDEPRDFSDESAAGPLAPAEEPPAPSGRAGFWLNPFLIALVVIGVGLIVVGVDRFVWASKVLTPSTSFASAATTPPADTDDVTAQVMWAIAPLMAVAGVLTLVGVVFFAALRWIPWSRSRTDADREDE